MFKLKANPTFWATVQVPRAGEEPAALDVEYRNMRRDELAAFIEGAKGQKDDDLIPQIVAGWKNVDADFSVAALKELLQAFPLAGGAIVESYLKELTEAKRKNS